MKKYTSRGATCFLVVAIICAAALLAGIILAFAEIENIGLPTGLISLGGWLGILFLGCYFAVKSRFLIIDTDKIILPRGAEIDGKTTFRKTVIKISEIDSIQCRFFKGDGLISKDTNFYTLKLFNGKKVTVTLYSFGKQAEKEIFKTIQDRIT